jgi:hypothetical protein
VSDLDNVLVALRLDAKLGANALTDAQRAAIEKLAKGDIKPFIESAENDHLFPLEDPAIAALAKLEKERPKEWERLRARLPREVPRARLDRLIRAENSNADVLNGGDGLPGHPVTFDDIEPWPEAVTGDDLLTELSSTIGTYMIMDKHQRDAAALGAVFAHTHDLRDIAPIFFVVSPTKRCGKSRLERVIRCLVPKPLLSSGLTAAFMARVIEKHRPTVLIDEYDATFRADRGMAENLRGQLN